MLASSSTSRMRAFWLVIIFLHAGCAERLSAYHRSRSGSIVARMPRHERERHTTWSDGLFSFGENYRYLPLGAKAQERRKILRLFSPGMKRAALAAFAQSRTNLLLTRTCATLKTCEKPTNTVST